MDARVTEAPGIAQAPIAVDDLDTTPPVLTGLTIVPGSTGSYSVDTSFQITATDTGGRGLGGAVITLDRDYYTGYGLTSSVSFSADGQENYTGYEQIGLYAGHFEIAHVSITDYVGNVADYDAGQLQALGIQTSFQVAGTPFTTPPVLTAFSLSPVVDVSSGAGNLYVSATATSSMAAGTGFHPLGRLFLTLDHPFFDGQDYQSVIGVGTDLFSSPTTASGWYSFGQNSIGAYSVTSAMLEDTLGNITRYTVGQLEAMGFNTHFVVTGNPDTTPPSLTALSAPSSVDVSDGGATFTVSAGASDTGGAVPAGVSRVVLTLDRAMATTSGLLNQVTLGAAPDTFADGSAATTLTVTRAAAGIYHFTGALVVDGAGNQHAYGAGDLQALGLPSSLAITDTVQGTPGVDTLIGGSGDDVIVGGGAADILTGADGADVFRYDQLSDSTPAAFDTLTDFQHGADRIDLTAVAGPLIVLLHDDSGSTGVFYGYDQGAFGGAISAALGDVEAPDVLATPATRFAILGGAGAETLIGGANADYIAGGGGADVLVGGAGADVFREAAASDSGQGGQYDYIADFEHGVDRLDLTGVSGRYVDVQSLPGGLKAVFYDLSNGLAQGALVVSGEIGAGDIVVDPGTVIVLDGSADADTLIGGPNGDAIRGGGGNDYIVGGGGQDSLSGGAGADVFAYTPVAADSSLSAPDYILDFEHGVDKIDLSRVSGPVVAIQHDQQGHSFLYYAVDGPVATGAITVVGDVEPGDLIVTAGVQVDVLGGAFAEPNPAFAAFDHVPFARPGESGHPSLF